VPAAILDFQKCTFGASRSTEAHNGEAELKFGENRLSGAKVIQFLVKFQSFKMASAAILDFEIHVFGIPVLLHMCTRLNL
jgi:hypothetical protein